MTGEEPWGSSSLHLNGCCLQSQTRVWVWVCIHVLFETELHSSCSKTWTNASSTARWKTYAETCTAALNRFITAPVSEFAWKLLQHLHGLSVVLQLGLHQRRQLAHLLDLHTQSSSLSFTSFVYYELIFTVKQFNFPPTASFQCPKLQTHATDRRTPEK